MQPGEKFVRCLLEQKDEEHRRARQLRRRTLLISIIIQALILTLLLLRPLFGAEEIALVARLIPLPPYQGGPATPAVPHRAPAHPLVHHVLPAPHPLIYVRTPSKATSAAEDAAPEIGFTLTASAGGSNEPGDPNGLIPVPGMADGSHPQPPPPELPVEPKRGPIRKPSEVQEAMLITRVEPQYPPLAKQIHLQGTVEIRAIIAADGSIESAEIVSGNLILAKAARDAVLRWRYRPTLLNGQPVEVETIIRVIFKMP